MAFEPKRITREHIIEGVQKIERDHIEVIPSTRWLVTINGKEYPPKEVMRYAHEAMNGEKVWEYGGGHATNKFLERLDFRISGRAGDPVADLVERYKKHIKTNGLQDEIYKWELLEKFKGRPDTDADNFGDELRGVNYANLIYPLGIGVVHHLAKERPEQYRTCFQALFDESKPIDQRLKVFNKNTLVLYR